MQSFLKNVDLLASHPSSLVGIGISHARQLLARSALSSHSIAVLRPGGMGDLVCLIIAMEELGLDPRSFFWLIERRSAGWAKYLGLNFDCYDETGILPSLRLAAKFSYVINTEQYFGLAQGLALLMKHPDGQLAGFSTNRCSRYADLAVEYDWKDSHEVVEFGRLIRTALRSSIPIQKEISSRPVRARKRESSGRRLICLAGLQSPTRSLSVDRWCKLINQWASKGGEIYLASAPEDQEFANQLLRKLGDRVKRFTGSFKELCDEIASAEELFTMDGGMVHIASYFGTPTTALFTSGRENKWAPLAEGSAVIKTHGLSCQPCTRFGQTPSCPNQLKCHEIDSI